MLLSEMTTNHPSAENLTQWLAQHQLGISSIAEMQEWINQDYEIICLLASQQTRSWSKSNSKARLVFELEAVKYSSMVSNSHHAPKNGVTNWSRRRDRVLGYPGWQGRIHVKACRDYHGFVSDLFYPLGIHTGCGGGCWTNSTYEIRWFASDWPGMSMAHSLTCVDDHT
jgi:hypothetical protein